MMPFAAEASDELVEVTTIPFHLTFQRMLVCFADAKAATWRNGWRNSRNEPALTKLTREESEILRALDLSPEDLQKTAAARASLEKSQRLSARAPFGGASPSEGFGGVCGS